MRLTNEREVKLLKDDTLNIDFKKYKQLKELDPGSETTSEGPQSKVNELSIVDEDDGSEYEGLGFVLKDVNEIDFKKGIVNQVSGPPKDKIAIDFKTKLRPFDTFDVHGINTLKYPSYSINFKGGAGTIDIISVVQSIFSTGWTMTSPVKDDSRHKKDYNNKIEAINKLNEMGNNLGDAFSFLFFCNNIKGYENAIQGKSEKLSTGDDVIETMLQRVFTGDYKLRTDISSIKLYFFELLCIFNIFIDVGDIFKMIDIEEEKKYYHDNLSIQAKVVPKLKYFVTYLLENKKKFVIKDAKNRISEDDYTYKITGIAADNFIGLIKTHLNTIKNVQDWNKVDGFLNRYMGGNKKNFFTGDKKDNKHGIEYLIGMDDKQFIDIRNRILSLLERTLALFKPVSQEKPREK